MTQWPYPPLLAAAYRNYLITMPCYSMYQYYTVHVLLLTSS